MKTKETRPGLNITVDRSLKDPRVPYIVEVNQQKANQLFISQNMDSNRLNNLTLYITRRPNRRSSGANGEYQSQTIIPGGQTIYLYTDTFWPKIPNQINNALLHEACHAIHDDQVASKELHLRTAIAAAVYGLPIAWAILGANYLENPPTSLIPLAGGFAGLFSVGVLTRMSLYYWNPVERRARDFAEFMDQKLEWANIITMKKRN